MRDLTRGYIDAQALLVLKSDRLMDLQFRARYPEFGDTTERTRGSEPSSGFISAHAILSSYPQNRCKNLGTCVAIVLSF
jgi:hypothetical protein